jgi:hypothetical protein
MHTGASAGTLPLILDDHTSAVGDALDAFNAETDVRPSKAPLPGPWDAASRETAKRNSAERWGALARNMQALNTKVDALSVEVQTLTSMVAGLALVTGVLVFATSVMLVMSSGITLQNLRVLFDDFRSWRF